MISRAAWIAVTVGVCAGSGARSAETPPLALILGVGYEHSPLA
jgi:hypothetical protein